MIVGVLTLAFPGTALGAQTHATRAATGVAAPSQTGARLGHTLLTLGTGYGIPNGSRLVRDVQRQLALAGYPTGRTDGLFGPRTWQAVVAFQASHGLPVDGIVGPRTWAALSARVLILGPGAGAQSGGSNAVRSLQRQLTLAGGRPGPIDGRYGVLTEGAVTRFQRGHRLPVSGIAGPRTLAVLHAATKPRVHARQRRLPRTGRRSKPASPPASGPLSAPAERPVTAPRTEPRAAVHRPGSGTPWVTILGALALALAFILAAPLLLGALRPERRRDDEESPVATADNGAVKPPVPGDAAVATVRDDRDSVADDSVADDSVADDSVADDSVEDYAWAFEFGHMLEAQGNVVEAQAAYRRADEFGHAAAASDLGRLLEGQGALAEAEAAYRRADERGDGAGAFNLGALLEDQGQLDEAAAAYRRAIDRGHDAGAASLGVLLVDMGARDDAEAAFRYGDERGDAAAAFNLGVMLEERGALHDAEAAFLRAEQNGNGNIADVARAALLDLRGGVQEAGADRAAQAHNA